MEIGESTITIKSGKELYATRRQIKLHRQTKRMAEHIEEGYEKKGIKAKTAKKRAWATVNKVTGGGKKSGSGRSKK